MNAPFIWIILPILVAGFLLLLQDERLIAFIASIFTIFLVVLAWLVPIDAVYSVGKLALKITPEIEILGRSLSLTGSDQPLLILVYGGAFLWFALSAPLHLARRLVPLGLGITALLVASLAVEPFLYAALLIELAVLLAIPILSVPGRLPGRGVLRFLIFQTLAMPFILFSGWLLAGIEASPGDLGMVIQAAILLGLGFTFLLSIFPFSTWLPMLAEETPAYLMGFIFWTFPVAGLLFLTNFIERYTWLRTDPNLPSILAFSGVLMITAGGILSAFENHTGRIMAYGVMLETGFSLLALSLNSYAGLILFFALFVPRLFSLLLWSFSLATVETDGSKLTFSDLAGKLCTSPFRSLAIILAGFTLVGLPMLAGFPIRHALFTATASVSPGITIWIFLGCIGMSLALVRMIFFMRKAPQGTDWQVSEDTIQRIILMVGCSLLILLGVFPHWITLFLNRMPSIYQYFVN